MVLTLNQLRACEDLEGGRRAPTTPLQEQFLKVCRGELPPVTEYEIEYLDWRLAQFEKARRRAAEVSAEIAASEKARERQRVLKANRTVKQLLIAERERLDLERARQFHSKPTRLVAEWGSRKDWSRDRNSYDG